MLNIKILKVFWTLLIALILLAGLSEPVMAAGGGGHSAQSENHIPVAMILTQLYNLGLLVAVLIYFLRSTVVDHFKTRYETYNENLTAADRAIKAAKEKQEDIKTRLQQLQATRSESLERAQKEAETMKQEMVGEAEKLSARMSEEAQLTATFERDRAIHELRTHLLEQSVDSARSSLSKNVQDQDLKRLQNEFVDKIQAVQ